MIDMLIEVAKLIFAAIGMLFVAIIAWHESRFKRREFKERFYDEYKLKFQVDQVVWCDNKKGEPVLCIVQSFWRHLKSKEYRLEPVDAFDPDNQNYWWFHDLWIPEEDLRAVTH